MDGIKDFFTNIGPLLGAVGFVIGAYLVLFWAASVLWAYRDIRSRSEHVSVQVLAVALVLCLPFFGIPLYMLLRPGVSLTEKYRRTLEEEYLRRDVEEQYVCPTCQRSIEHDFMLCPHCYTALRRRCSSCDRIIDLTWSVCPYCGSSGSVGTVSVYKPSLPRPMAQTAHLETNPAPTEPHPASTKHA